MRAWRLLALLVAVITSGCCSTHRAWLDGYSACVPECGSCDCGSGGFLGHKSCLFQKKSNQGCRCHSISCDPCGGCDPCGSCGDCLSDCGSPFTNCSSCAGEVMWDGTMNSGCPSCAQGQTVFNGSMPSSGGCQHCMQNQMQMAPAPANSQQVPMAPAPPSIPAVPPAEPAPEPHKAQMMQLQAIPTQPVQYQEAAPPAQVAPPASSYNPPAAPPAVQPVLWVPAVPSTPAPLMVPATR